VIKRRNKKREKGQGKVDWAFEKARTLLISGGQRFRKGGKGNGTRDHSLMKRQKKTSRADNISDEAKRKPAGIQANKQDD